MITVEILICTIGKGIFKVPSVMMERSLEGVSYLVSWQTDGTVALPPTLQGRADVRVVTHSSVGLSRNRNFAIHNAKANVLVISDDDTRYSPHYIDNIRQAFARYADADIICFQALDYTGHPLKAYSASGFLYPHRPKAAYFSSVELAIRKESPIPAFDERFGLGAEHLECGEEDIFLHDAYQRGLTIRYVPLPIVRTVRDTTGGKFMESQRVQRSKGAVYGHLFSLVGAVLRCLKFVLTLHPASPWDKASALWNMLWGVAYAKYTSKQPRSIKP